jgi:hypothetical protein
VLARKQLAINWQQWQDDAESQQIDENGQKDDQQGTMMRLCVFR